MPEIDEKSFLEEEDLQTWNSRPFCHLVDLLSKRIVTAGVSPRRIVAREVPDQPQPGRDTIYHVRGILGMLLLKTKGPWKRRKREKLSAGRKNDREKERQNGERERDCSVNGVGPVYIVGDRWWWWGREGTHKAEILRAGAGAPRGLRRRNHNAERSWADYLWDYHLRVLLPLLLPCSAPFRNVFYRHPRILIT